MITKIEIWKTDDGKAFDTEVEALRYENNQLREELDKLKWFQACQKPVYQQPEPLKFYGYAPNSQMYPTTGLTGSTLPSGISGICDTVFSGELPRDFVVSTENFLSPDPFMFGGSDFPSGIDAGFNAYSCYTD